MLLQSLLLFALGTFEEYSQAFIDFLLVWLFVVFCLQFTWLGVKVWGRIPQRSCARPCTTQVMMSTW